MQYLYAFLLCFIGYSTQAQFTSKKVNLTQEAESDKYSVAIIFNNSANLSSSSTFLNKEERGKYVYNELNKQGALQKKVINYLKAQQVIHRKFYIVNMITCELAPTQIKHIAKFSEVKKIIDNGKISLQNPIRERKLPVRSGIEWGIDSIGAPLVWNMGYTGQGVVIGGQDTGYDWDHPAIINQYRGWNGSSASHNYNWHDAIHQANINNPCGSDSTEPCDDHNHGTHTMGTMVGDDGAGNQIGVAPGAKWIACRNMDQGNGTLETYVECFEWFLAPYPVGASSAQGDPTMAPHVINNSWACPPSEGCMPSNFIVLEEALMNLRNSGVVVVVSNGNNGGDGCESTYNPPAFFSGSFSVGSTTSTNSVSSFSSRGPVTIDGSGRLKPNVVAPGSGVRSCIRNNGYASYSGTSMAGPHVAGTVALIISANPSLAGRVEQIERIIEETAVPIAHSLSCGGLTSIQIPNNVIGYGLVDAKAAVDRALNELYVPIIKVDQFGYLPNARKIAYLSDPHFGYNSMDSYLPPSTVYVKDAITHQVVYSAAPSIWQGGMVDDLSGDKVWWFDFTDIVSPGTYYVSDNSYRSEDFVIGKDVYNDALQKALKTFYYQRCGVPKTSTYSQFGYTDPVCHTQDIQCRYIKDPDNTALYKNMSGGWHDAGDYNKYVNFSYAAVLDMLMAYEYNPQAWNDHMGLPESENGIPDLLDEIKIETDWLLRMQDSDGGIFSVVGTTGFAAENPPSTDNHIRYYGSKSTSASYSGAAMFGFAAIQLKKINNLLAQNYAATLQQAAIDAYDWGVNNPNLTYYNRSDDLAAGEQELVDTNSIEPYYKTDMRQLSAAIFLYTLTGDNIYKNYVESNYSNAHLLQWNYAYVFEAQIQYCLLYYAHLEGVSTSVAHHIKSTYQSSVENNSENLPSILASGDAYRSYLKQADIGWGSNSSKCQKGIIYHSYRHYGLNSAYETIMRDAMDDFIHYIHGANPTGLCYLTNMESYGADRSVNSIYHGWFTDGHPDWDDVRYSTFGPPPGFLPGGPNSGWSLDGCCANNCNTNPLCINQVPPSGQPPLKAYYDWNTSWPQNSWMVTENAIYYQSAYLLLLSSRVELADTLENVNAIVKIMDTDFEIGSITNHIILTSPDFSRYRIQVDNHGKLNTVQAIQLNSPVTTLQNSSLLIKEVSEGLVLRSPDGNYWRIRINRSGDEIVEFLSTEPDTFSGQITGDFLIDSPSQGLLIKDPDGYCFRIEVDNQGEIFTKSVYCP